VQESHRGHGQHRYDPHIWLSPRNAENIARIVLDKLLALDPGNATTYKENYRSLISQIQDLEQQLQNQTAAIQDIPFLVFHDAYQYFERQYRLNAIGSVTLSAERSPGAKRIHQIRRRIKEQNSRCIFREPQFEPKLLATLVEGSKTRTDILDPLGAELTAGPDAYFTLMRNLSGNLAECLGPVNTN